MAITKRLRYEVLRRDNHTCRYCGRAAPAVALTVDHVVPVALGGTDEPTNLAAACVDCNAGKSSTNPGAPLLDDVANDALRWANAMRHAADVRRAKAASEERLLDEFGTEWDAYRRQGYPLPRDDEWKRSISTFVAAGLDLADLLRFVAVAHRAKVPYDAVWRYFCGVCWAEIRDRQHIARQLLDAEEAGNGA